MANVLKGEPQTRLAPASVPRLWARPAASRDNLVVITADELIVATVPRAKLAAIVDALESGVPTRDLIGPQDMRVALGSIVSLAASVNARQLVIEFEPQRRKLARRQFAVYDADAQGEILEEVARRMGPRAAYVRTAPHRLLHVMKPFNLLMAIAVVAGGFNYLAVNTFRIDSNGMPRDLSSGRASSQQRLVQFRQFAARLPKVRFVPFAGSVVLAAVVVTGFLLLTAGYQTTLTALMVAAGLSAFWILRRSLFPPVTVSVVNSRFTSR